MNIVKKSIVEFCLEQGTPMIHFQGEEKSAGIRASDLKPRFDAFLKRYWYDLKVEIEKTEIENCILKQDEEEIENNASDEKKRVSFDYKVKILNNGCKNSNMTFYKEEKKDKNSFYGSFYGNLEDDKFSFYNEINVLFLSPHQDLRNQIQELFPVFLAVNGFGLRNNKGYGYFKLKGNTKKEILEDIQKYQKLENRYIEQLKAKNNEKGVGVYQLQIENKGGSASKKVQNLLENIKSFHQILKSGFNFRKNVNYNSEYDAYIPSLMIKKYKKQEGVLFEKKSLKLLLKEKGYDITELTKKDDAIKKGKQEDLKNQKLYYVRGLLGLPSSYEFRRVKKGNGVEFKAKFNVKIKGVERFPSPIKYLPISYEEIIILVDYSKIEEFRKKGSKVSSAIFSLNRSERELSLKINLQIPNEEQYSIHQLFKINGVIENGIKETKEC
ncbi:MAG: hypothetical protein Q4A19_08990, partial [Johnsonella sp.]|nr:hypothetical protein [Johnsonella sp.]